MKIAILGYGDQGKAAYEYWNQPGNELTVCDHNDKIKVPAGAASRLGPDYLKNLAEFDLLIRTPALHPRDIAAANPESPAILDKVTTVTNEFIKVCPSRHIIGVTGTKGKGTTSTLIAKMLEAAGKKVHLGGNIGTPPLDMLKAGIKADDWVVLELANFQLIDLKQSPSMAVCLMVVAEHLDWHRDVSEYIEAKQQLFAHQQPEDTAIYYALNANSEHIAGVSPGHKIPYMKHPGADVIEGAVTIDGQAVCKVEELKLLGEHNWQNVCAAVTTIYQIDKDIEAMRSVLTAFSGLPHRLEFVRELDDVKYYNDSFGTTPDTAIVAIKAFNQPKVVILGGSTKGAEFTDLADTVKNGNVRQIILVGNTTNSRFKAAAPDILAALQAKGFDNITSLVKAGGPTTDEIVQTARQAAQPGDIVLLSAGCASFDIFSNYKERGEQFKQAVLKLA